jgi:hypothetical protein
LKFAELICTCSLRPDEAKEDGMGRECSTNGEKINAYGILVGKPEGKRPLGIPSHRLVDNFEIDLTER